MDLVEKAFAFATQKMRQTRDEKNIKKRNLQGCSTDFLSRDDSREHCLHGSLSVFDSHLTLRFLQR